MWLDHVGTDVFAYEFTPNTTVTLSVNGVEYSSDVSDDAGDAWLSIQGKFVAGSHPVTISDGTQTVTATLVVTEGGYSPWVNVIYGLSKWDMKYDGVSVWGVGFPSDSLITVTFDGVEVATLTTGESGATSTTIFEVEADDTYWAPSSILYTERADGGPTVVTVSELDDAPVLLHAYGFPLPGSPLTKRGRRSEAGHHHDTDESVAVFPPPPKEYPERRQKYFEFTVRRTSERAEKTSHTHHGSPDGGVVNTHYDTDHRNSDRDPYQRIDRRNRCNQHPHPSEQGCHPRST